MTRGFKSRVDESGGLWFTMPDGKEYMLCQRSGELEATEDRAMTDYYWSMGHDSAIHVRELYRLIAAAPELLEALKDFVRIAENGKHIHLQYYLNTIGGARMKAALAKAEGKEP